MGAYALRTSTRLLAPYPLFAVGMDSDSNHSPAAFSPAERDVLYRVMRSRRDIRRFLPQPIPADVLSRILEMAHYAPSVGFMQPWNFILVSSLDLRRQIKSRFEAVNAAAAAPDRSLADRRDLYASLKLEGILEAPLNLVVTCDHRRDAPFVLGRGPDARNRSLQHLPGHPEHVAGRACRRRGRRLGEHSRSPGNRTTAGASRRRATRRLSVPGLSGRIRRQADAGNGGLEKPFVALDGLVFEDRWGQPRPLFAATHRAGADELPSEL